MDISDTELLKRRELRFCGFGQNRPQAELVAEFLLEIEGILRIEVDSPTMLSVEYDLSKVHLQGIDALLEELEFHLDGSLLNKMKRSLYYYTEEIQRANMGIHTSAEHSSQIFVNRYEHLGHGCQDRRPEHWRNYL